MTNQEAMEILKLYFNWNTENMAITGNKEAQAVYDYRRKLIQEASRQLLSTKEEQPND